MRTTYQQITSSYAILSELVLDIHNFLQDSKNYDQFDPNIKACILGTQVMSPDIAYIEQLPQVKLLKNIRESFRVVANDFQSNNILKILLDTRKFKSIVELYLHAEETISLSPEFNSKMLSLFNFLIQNNQDIYEELHSILQKPPLIFKDNHNHDDNIDTKKWHYYHDRITNLLQILPNNHKLKPYINYLEHILAFIIKIKEKGILRPNIITNVLNFFESINNISHTSIKEILREYAIVSEKEINEILTHVNYFWASFLPLCDEIEIDLGLKTGYLTEHLNPALKFCNMTEVEFNHNDTGSAYPFTELRLNRIKQSIEQTNIHLAEELKRKQKLSDFNANLIDWIDNKNASLQKLISFHQYIDLLNLEASRKIAFHQLLDKEIKNLSKVEKDQLASTELEQLISKYKLRTASLEETQTLLTKLQESDDEQKTNIYVQMLNEYIELRANLPTFLQKIEKGKLSNNDLKHLLIMCNVFADEADEQSTQVKTAINNQINNLEKFQKLLILFEKDQLPKKVSPPLYTYIDFLDCDASIKKKYKKQIVDLDHKSKNSGYLRLAADFVLGLFTEVTVPFSEIQIHIQNKIHSLHKVAAESLTTQASSSNSLNTTIDSIKNFISEITFSDLREWYNLTDQVELDIKENANNVATLQSIKTYQENRVQELKHKLQSHIEPIKIEVILKEPTQQPFTWRDYLKDFTQFIITKSTSLVTTIYSKTKSAYNYVKSFFTHEPSNNPVDNLEIVRVEKTPPTSVQEPEKIEVEPDNKLDYVEKNIELFFEKIVDPKYHSKLRDALNSHQILNNLDNEPYFYKQSADIINLYILFRKVLLSYSNWDMLQFSLAAAKLNVERKVLHSILEQSTLAQSFDYFQQIINPILTRSYQTVTNIKNEENIETSLPRVIHNLHHAIALIANNRKLNLTPLVEFLKRVGDKTNQSQSEDLQKVYSSINKLINFVEKVVNNQQNFLVEVLFSLADLSHHIRQLSNSITGLLLKDNFPYIQELSEVMQDFQYILLALQNDTYQIQAAGLHPDLITSLTDCIQSTNKLVSQLTPLKFKQEKLLLEIDQLKFRLLSCGNDRILHHELENMHLLLTTESDQKFIDQEVLNTIETRLNEIKEQRKETYSQGCFSFFGKWNNPFVSHESPQVNSSPSLVKK